MSRLYIDTNVVLDAAKNRHNLLGKNIGSAAARIFYDAVQCYHYLIISTWMLEELYRFVDPDSVAMLFTFTQKKLIRIQYTDGDKASVKGTLNPDDALHIELAKKSKADHIVTRDVEHFKKLGAPMPVSKPEYLF